MITIGLGTISLNLDCECLIFAAGEAKAKAVSCCEEEYAPVGLLEKKLRNFQLFLTRGAAKNIHAERLRSVSAENFESEISRIFTSAKCQLSAPLEILNPDDLEIYTRIVNFNSHAPEAVRVSLEEKIAQGVEISSLSGFNFIHFEPHHDDILLGYFPLLIRLLSDTNFHHFVTCTAGFNSVSDAFAVSLAENYPGLSGEELKTKIREAESEAVWRSIGFGPGNWTNLNLPFYSSSIFNVIPGADDVQAILDLLKNRAEISDSDLIVTVAVDPESSGPDTHFKCLQAITEALVLFQKEAGEKFINIWGYRNVWTNFETSETTALVPVSDLDLKNLEISFLENYKSQASAEFPSPELDGPFSSLATKIMRQQADQLRCLLGTKFFDDHSSHLIRCAAGFLFIKEMTVEELVALSRSSREAFAL